MSTYDYNVCQNQQNNTMRDNGEIVERNMKKLPQETSVNPVRAHLKDTV